MRGMGLVGTSAALRALLKATKMPLRAPPSAVLEVVE